MWFCACVGKHTYIHTHTHIHTHACTHAQRERERERERETEWFHLGFPWLNPFSGRCVFWACPHARANTHTHTRAQIEGEWKCSSYLSVFLVRSVLFFTGWALWCWCISDVTDGIPLWNQFCFFSFLPDSLCGQAACVRAAHMPMLIGYGILGFHLLNLSLIFNISKGI